MLVQKLVTPAQPLFTLVPKDQPVEVEAMLENKDIGFVQAGQAVTVKTETFNFTKYGLLNGEVISVLSDAIEDEKRGLIYSTKIKLDSNTLYIDDHTVNLVPGMVMAAEIKIDQRRIIKYFLRSLEKYLEESIRER